ncbi:uncharacterized protein LOC124645979 [Helicoverpa zea]|uniref:uncharacterized protein LOC124645979 n=1 Tax=Helicoverpa zea TaxID=7113 RepID=UPI001F5A8721|nr:uncharacterized protein LOC124645979 [Helicoverpa zea]
MRDHPLLEMSSLMSRCTYCTKDSEEPLFNFVPMEAVHSDRNKGNQLHLKRPNGEDNSVTSYTFIKKPALGFKIVRIEIYDAKDFMDREDTLCKCKAELCAQHVVKHVLFDDIYKSANELIQKIQNNLEN